MPPLAAIAFKDLRQRFRDRSAIVLGFVAPLAIAALMSFAFRDTEHFHITVGVVDRDHGAVAGAFVDFMTSPDLHDVVTTRVLADEATARREVYDGKLEAAVVVPPGFTKTATNPDARARTDLTVLTNTDSQLGGEVTRSLAASFVNQVNADRLSVSTALARGVPADQLATLTSAAAQLRVPENVVNRPIGSKPLKVVSYYAPAMAIFFLFFAIGFSARSFFSEVRDGMVDRIAAAPLRPVTMLFGKALSVAVYGVASLGTVLVVTSLFFGADWGNPLAAMALCFGMILAVVVLTALVIAISRTEQQAEGIAAVLVFGLALLGGNFVTISATPPLLRRLALLTPNGWALRGFVDLTTGASSTSVLQPLLAMIVFSVVIGVLAAVLGRRRFAQ